MPEQKWWHVFPWQTPTGEGFRRIRLPWTTPEQYWGKAELDRNTYLERLYYYINAQVQLGAVTPTQGNAVLESAKRTAGDWSEREKLPYWKEVMVPEWEWYEKTAKLQTAQRKGWVEQQQKEARKREYLPQLREYLERGVSMGQISPAQLEQSMASETQGIELGMPLKDLPTYAGVQDYQAYQERQQQLRQQILTGKGPEAQRRGLEEAYQKTGWRQLPGGGYYRGAAGLQKRIELRGQAGQESAWQEKMRREKETEFEAGRQTELAGLTGPVNWIKKWFAEHKPSPFARREAGEGLGEEIARIEAQHIVGPGKEFADWGEREARMSELRSAQKGAGGPGYVGYGPGEAKRKREPRPIAPATPGWLAELTGLKAGQPIEKMPVTTPSASWFARQPWSVREGLRGYTEWAGGRAYEDIVEEMYRMLPRTPRGAGATRWQAPRQWA